MPELMTVRAIIDELSKLPEDKRPKREAKAQTGLLLMNAVAVFEDTPPVSDEDWQALNPDMRAMALMGLTVVLAQALQED